jgi:ABC-type dipeptide/oligopeptide/nickel transport system permease subunit
MTQAEDVSRLEAPEEFAPRRERGLWSDAFRRLIRNRLAMVGLFVLVVVALLAFLGNHTDLVQRYDPAFDHDYSARQEAPSAAHFFGTDYLGRDNWARVLQGVWISLQVGVGVQVIVVAIGMLVGGIAALGGRALDNLMMRITDLAYAFPDLLFIILLRSALAGRHWPILGEPVLQMIVRGQMLS